MNILKFFILMVVLPMMVSAQTPLPFSRVSPSASVSQNLDNFIVVSIDYNRPQAKGRTLWGQVVPWEKDQPVNRLGASMPWRAGANENTVLSLSHDGKINGKDIKAGRYGLHVIPRETGPWTLILSSDYQAWGSYFYTPDHDVLRTEFTPVEADHREWLQFGFENLSQNGMEAYLHWGTKKLMFTIEFDVHAINLAEFDARLTNLAGFNAAAWASAAGYCIANNYRLDQALVYIEKALGMPAGNTFNNKIIKSNLLSLTGRDAESDKMINEALEIATENELNAYGYQLKGKGSLEKAIDIFKLNVQRHPQSWNVFDSLAEALMEKGDKEGAKINYEKSLQLAPDSQKARLQKILSTF